MNTKNLDDNTQPTDNSSDSVASEKKTEEEPTQDKAIDENKNQEKETEKEEKVEEKKEDEASEEQETEKKAEAEEEPAAPNVPSKTYENLLTVGIVGFDDMQYLWQLFSSLLKTAQGVDNFKVLFLENGDNQGTAEFIKETFPSVEVFVEEKNLGLARGHNYLIQKSDSKYYFCLNSDAILGENALGTLLSAMEANERIAAASPLILEWDYHNHQKHNLSNKIEMAGLEIAKSQRVKKRFFGENADNKFSQEESVWGFSNTAVMLRRDALENVAHNEGEYFDNDFFFFNEDIDLAYRMRWAGWNIVFEPNAKAWHDLNSGNKKRETKYRIEKHKNRYLFLQKNFIPFIRDFSPEIKKAFYANETRRAMKAFFTEPIVFLKGFFSSQKMWKKMGEKALKMPRAIAGGDMEKFFMKD